MRHLQKEIWPFCVTLPNDIGTENTRTTWLHKNVGTNTSDWYVIGLKPSTYYFKKEADYLMFILKWS